MSSRRDAGAWVLAAEALWWLVVFRAATLVVPFRRLSGLLRLAPYEPAAVVPSTTPSSVDAERVGWAVGVAAARTPWVSTCLIQSLAGSTMLRRRGVASTVLLGVAKAPGGDDFAAHSWLECDGVILTGGAARPAFTPIAAYRAGPA